MKKNLTKTDKTTGATAETGTKDMTGAEVLLDQIEGHPDSELLSQEVMTGPETTLDKDNGVGIEGPIQMIGAGHNPERKGIDTEQIPPIGTETTKLVTVGHLETEVTPELLTQEVSTNQC